MKDDQEQQFCRFLGCFGLTVLLVGAVITGVSIWYDLFGVIPDELECVMMYGNVSGVPFWFVDRNVRYDMVYVEGNDLDGWTNCTRACWYFEDEVYWSEPGVYDGQLAVEIFGLICFFLVIAIACFAIVFQCMNYCWKNYCCYRRKRMKVSPHVFWIRGSTRNLMNWTPRN